MTDSDTKPAPWAGWFDPRPAETRPQPVLPLVPLARSAADAPTDDERAATPEAGDGPPEQPPGGRLLGHLSGLFLAAVLTVQAVRSLQLVWSNTAFVDEAAYLSAGHAIIAHWLHGTPVADYSSYLPGAPVLYPPVGALADSLGGLTGARVLSLLFMLGATALLWSLTGKLFGGRAAGCAAALFAVLGPTVRLGAFATFDPMALLLLAAAAWCVVAARDRDDSARLLVAGIVLLTLANAARYATVPFDPAVVALAGLTTARHRGVKAGVARAGYVAVGTTGLLSLLLAVGGAGDAAGVLAAIGTQTGGSPARLALADSWHWIGPICLIAAAGAVVAAWRNRSEALILAVFAATGLLAPLNEVRVHATAVSLSGYVSFGAWFAAVAAGYVITRLTTVGRRKPLYLALTGVVLGGAVVPLAFTGRQQAAASYRQWPNSARLIAALGPLVRQHPGRYLAEDDSVPAYYLRTTVPASQWSGTFSFNYKPPGSAQTLTGPAAYQAAIDHHYFALIIVSFTDTVQTDGEIVSDLGNSGDYRVVAVASSTIGQYTIWAYEPQPAAPSHPSHPGRHGHR
ncbi:MAG: glycosyltransferase family 39 protein [Actinobacteria bacterium]|nr:glycosyltransferase family 39 protein [Actinomycetota bacterium]